MIKYLASLFVVALGYMLLTSQPVSAADSLQVRPLLYQETIEKNQAKRGAIDIANGSEIDAEYSLSVRLFRQASNDGSLEFYDNPDVTDGIQLDITEVALKSKEVARVTFGVDGAKLPEGDIFAVIFVTTKHATTPHAIVPAAQVGTLLILQNGTPGPRQAEIQDLALPQIQTGDKIKGTVTVRNPAAANVSTGFFPQMSVKVEPWGAASQFNGPLVYASKARTFDFSVPSNQFGFFKVTVTANNASQSQYVFLITGVWRTIVGIVLIALFIVAVGLTIWRVLRRRKRRKSKQ